MIPKIPKGNELKRQVAVARAAEANDRTRGRRASSVRYDPTHRRVVVELTNGLQIAFPLSVFPEVAKAPASVLATVSRSPSGSGIVWKSLDADYSVPGLLAWAAGAHAGASALGRLGGSTRSDAKSAAARANGARGGRPRMERTKSAR